VQILALFEEKIVNHWTSYTLAGYPAGHPVSGLTGYPAGKFGMRPDIKKRPDYPAGYPVHP
jgi:hypothetical protein